MDRPGSVVVVGGGLAAAKAAEGLRSGGFDGSITIVGEERAAPYERPPLSKGYLMGTEERETVFAPPRGLVCGERRRADPRHQRDRTRPDEPHRGHL